MWGRRGKFMGSSELASSQQHIGAHLSDQLADRLIALLASKPLEEIHGCLVSVEITVIVKDKYLDQRLRPIKKGRAPSHRDSSIAEAKVVVSIPSRIDAVGWVDHGSVRCEVGRRKTKLLASTTIAVIDYANRFV
jgi:hypothetical protein